MKKLLIEIVLGVVTVALIIILIIVTTRQRKEIQRVKNNLEIQLREDFSKEQEITKQELKKYYEGLLDSIKDVAGVKPKQIEHIVQVHYNYIDSTVYVDSMIYIYDTIHNIGIHEFAFATMCNYIEGKVIGDSITLTKLEYTDDISIVLYREKKKCLFKPKSYRACAISSCRNDTIAISNNLHVVKRNGKSLR